MAGSGGHPQMVQAVISGLRMRGWPEEEITRFKAFDALSDIESERLAARRLISALPSAATAFLYRTSLLFGRFDRDLALALGAIEPPIAQPGAQLDLLIGPWVEAAGRSRFRMSPLLQGAGNDILTPEERAQVHRTAAEQIMGGRSVDVDKAGTAFSHALLGRAEWVLMRSAYGIIQTTGAIRRELAEWMPRLRLHRLDAKIYADRPALSILLRLAQFLLVAETARRTAILNCWNVLLAELRDFEDVEAREQLEYMILAKALLNQATAGILADCVELILRFEELSQQDEVRLEFLHREPRSDGRHSPGLFATMFVTQVSRISRVAELQRAFDRLDVAKPEQRQTLLADVPQMPSDFGLVVNHAWLEESKRENPDWPSHADAYRAMAVQAQRWGYDGLAMRCYIARGVILEEYLDDPTAGLQALDEAKSLLGDSAELARARAKILYRRKDHEGALNLLREAADRTALNDPVARTYMLREAGICAAEIGQWAEARQWFEAAREAAGAATSASMKLIAVGLRADEAIAAYKAGNAQAALRGLDATLDEIGPIDPSSSIAAGYRHRVIRHSILWLFGQATGEDVGVDEVPTVMLPGICSNPEPTDLSDMPLGSADCARYLLAQAEISFGSSAGIEASLRAHLGGRAIPNMELMLRGTRMEYCVRRFDAKGLIANLPSWIDGRVYLDTHREVVRQSNPCNPAYGEVDPATPDQLRGELAIATAADLLLAFCIMTAVQQQPAALVALCDLSAEIQPGYAGKEVLALMASGDGNDEELPAFVAVQVHKIAHHPDLTPDEVFVAGVRFVQWAKRSNFQKVLAPAIEKWARARWANIIEEQRFNLRNPVTSVPPIGDALASTETRLKFLGRLLVAAQPAMRTKFDQGFREFLLSL
jgi:tetratricopeptide (TPR) repeat protein